MVIGMLLISILVSVLLIIVAIFFSARRTQQHLTNTFSQSAPLSVVRQGGSVVAYHPLVREIGEEILRSGGNAFDAFVAAVAAENVMAEGVSSLAGPLGVLLYRAGDGQVAYMDADYNDPLEPSGDSTAGEASIGKSALVPGAPAGLEALANAYGTIPFAELLQPAIRLAEDGFPIHPLLSDFISRYARLLKRTKYGRSTFFRDGEPLRVGDILRQPELGGFLRGLAQQGSAYVYGGAWGDRFLATVQEKGGSLTASDLASYQVNWHEPRTTTYRGHTIFTSSGHTYGGLWSLLALKTLEHTTLPPSTHYSQDADALEQLIRISREVWAEPDLLDYKLLDDPAAVESLLSFEHTSAIWERVRDKAPFHATGGAGAHSYHLIVTDREGNIANGTTTIESDPWANGLFVEGVILPNSGNISTWRTEPGLRRLSPFSIHLVLEDAKPRFAVGAISNSVVETAFQFLVNLIDYKMAVDDVVTTPRFGTFPSRGTVLSQTVDLNRNWLDPRVERSVVQTLKERGIRCQQRGVVDTGLGTVARVGPDGTVEGNTAPIPYISGPF